MKEQEFSALDAFMALNDIDDEEVSGMLKSSKLTEGKQFSIYSSNNDLKKAKDILAEKDENAEIEVIDVDADSIDHLKKKEDYIGQIILRCNKCMANRFIDADKLVPSEDDPDVMNVEDECPHCHSSGDGYEQIGQVGKVEKPADVVYEEPVVDNDETVGEEDATFDNDLGDVDTTEETAEENNNQPEGTGDEESDSEYATFNDEEESDGMETETSEDELDDLDLPALGDEAEEDVKKDDEEDVKEALNELYKVEVSDYAKEAWKMGQVMLCMDNEEAYYGSWITIWPDEDIESEEDAAYYFNDKEDFEDLETEFIRNYKRYHEDGLFDAPDDVVDYAHKWDEKLGLAPIENILPKHEDKKLTEAIEQNTVLDFLGFITDPEAVKTIEVWNNLPEDSEKVFKGNYEDLPDNIINGAFVSFNVADGYLTCNIDTKNDSENKLSDALNLFDDETSEKVMLWDEETGDTIFEGTKEDAIAEYGDAEFISFESPEYLVINISDEDVMSSVTESVNNGENLFEAICKANNLHAYKIVNKASNEYWINESLGNNEDLDFVYRHYVLPTNNSALIERFKSETGYKDIVDEAKDRLSAISLNEEEQIAKTMPAEEQKATSDIESKLMNMLKANDLMTTDAIVKYYKEHNLGSETKYSDAMLRKVLGSLKVNEAAEEDDLAQDLVDIADEPVDSTDDAVETIDQPLEAVAVDEPTNIDTDSNKILADLLIDEKEAVDGYNKAIDALNSDDGTTEKAKEVLKHISEEELEHIEELSKVVAGTEDEIVTESFEDEHLGKVESDDDWDESDDDWDEEADEFDRANVEAEKRSIDAEANKDVEEMEAIHEDTPEGVDDPDVEYHDIHDIAAPAVQTSLSDGVTSEIYRVARTTADAIRDNYGYDVNPEFIAADIIQDLRLISRQIRPEDLEDTPINELTKQMFQDYEHFYDAVSGLIKMFTGRDIEFTPEIKLNQALKALSSKEYNDETIKEKIASPQFVAALESGRVPFVIGNNDRQALIGEGFLDKYLNAVESVKSFKDRKSLGEAIEACKNNNRPYSVRRSTKEGFRYDLVEALARGDKEAAEDIKNEIQYYEEKSDDQPYNADKYEDKIENLEQALTEEVVEEAKKDEEIDKVLDSMEKVETVVNLIGDAVDAVETYSDAIETLEDSKMPNKEEIISKLHHIKGDELKHIDDLKDVQSMMPSVGDLADEPEKVAKEEPEAVEEPVEELPAPEELPAELPEESIGEALVEDADSEIETEETVDDHFTKQDIEAVVDDVVDTVEEVIDADAETTEAIEQAVEDKLEEIFPEDAEKESDEEISEEPVGEALNENMSIEEALHGKKEIDDFFRLCKEIGIETFGDLKRFKDDQANRVRVNQLLIDIGPFGNMTTDAFFETLKDYRKELGSGFRIKESAELETKEPIEEVTIENNDSVEEVTDDMQGVEFEGDVEFKPVVTSDGAHEVEEVTIEQGDETVEVEVKVDPEPIEAEADENNIEPDNDEELDFDEEAFDKDVNEYFDEAYEDSLVYRTTAGNVLENGTIMLEGFIRFNEDVDEEKVRFTLTPSDKLDESLNSETLKSRTYRVTNDLSEEVFEYKA